MSFQERMHQEFAELACKLDKLEAFLGTDIFDAMDEVDQQLLLAQYNAMNTYSTILDVRRLKEY